VKASGHRFLIDFGKFSQPSRDEKIIEHRIEKLFCVCVRVCVCVGGGGGSPRGDFSGEWKPNSQSG